MSGDTSNFLVAEAQLALDLARKKKAERTKTIGDPIELPGKALAIEVRDGIAWIAENTTVVRKIDLESCKTGKPLCTFKGHTGPVTSLAFCDRRVKSGDKEILISGSWDKSIKLWDTVTNELTSSTPDAHDDFVKTLLVFPSLQILVSGGSDKIVRFWDLSNLNRPEPLKSLGSISSHTRPVECLDGRAISNDLAVLYTGDTMGIIKFWNLNKGPSRWTATLICTHDHHRTRINELIYDNGQLWTASADETVQVILDESMPMDDCSNATAKAFKPLTHPVAVRAILPLNLSSLSEPYLLTAAGEVLRIYNISVLDEPEYIGEVDAHWHDITAVRVWMRKFVGDGGKARVEPWIITTSLDRTIRKWKLAELLSPAAVKVMPEIQEQIPPQAVSGITEDEEDELAKLMEDD